jgi:hypothetical protein
MLCKWIKSSSRAPEGSESTVTDETVPLQLVPFYVFRTPLPESGTGFCHRRVRLGGAS